MSNPSLESRYSLETTFTIRNLPYTYIHLCLTYPTPSGFSAPGSSLDILTAHTSLQAALSRFLGLHGAAVSIDILHVETEKPEFWIRVPREDGDKVAAAVAGWSGNDGRILRVKGRGDWLGGIVMGEKDVWR